MKIELEEKAKLVALGVGYYQIIDGDKFEPAAIGFSDEKIVIYSDFEPDEIQTKAFAYSIKKAIPVSEIKAVIIEKIANNRELNRFNRIQIIMKAVEESTCFYYDKNDKKYMKRFFGALKYAEIRIIKRTVDLSPAA